MQGLQGHLAWVLGAPLPSQGSRVGEKQMLSPTLNTDQHGAVNMSGRADLPVLPIRLGAPRKPVRSPLRSVLTRQQ